MIRMLADGSAVVSEGPLHMTVSVLQGESSSPELAQKGGERALDVLKLMADFLPILRQKAFKIKQVRNLPPAVQRAVEVTRAMAERDLTSLASVAGIIADEVADFLERAGGCRIIVNNGGDIALRLRWREKARVGVRICLESSITSYALLVKGENGIGGVATSGLGGRSFTKGIASAAVAIASSAGLADAAATVIGNATWVDDAAISTELAEKIYPDTDIPGARVVTHVGKIPKKKIEKALERGLEKASFLVKQELIRGAIIAVRGNVRFTEGIAEEGKALYIKESAHARSSERL